MPRASICMPIYRPGAAFQLAIASALKQTFTDFEIIVTDDSVSDLRGLLPNDPRIRYFHNSDRLGFNRNHSHVLDLASGDYVAILQQDDLWEPTFLAEAIQALENNRSVGFVFVATEDIDGAGASLGMRPARTAAGIVRNPLEAFLRGNFMLLLPSVIVFRAEALAANERPWPDIPAWWDNALYYDVVMSGWDVYFLDRPLAKYRSHSEQASGDKLRHRNAVVSLFETYHFAEPRAEKMKTDLLTLALQARAGVLVRIGNGQGARADLRRAHSLNTQIVGLRWITLYLLSYSSMSVIVVDWVWRRLHDPLRNRHKGL